MNPTGEIRVRVSAHAKDGEANREVLRYLAERLGLAPSRLALVSGKGSRHKVIEVEGLTGDEVRSRLEDKE